MGIGLAVGALAAGIGAGSTFALTGIALGFSLQAAVTSLVLGALQSVLTPKPKSLGNLSSFSARSEGITQNIQQAITSRRILYGEARIGAALTFSETTSSDRFLHFVLTLVDHEVEEIGEIWFGDVSIPEDAIDGDGEVISGAFSGKARIKKHLGTAGQTADADLVSETSVDTNFRGRGVAYLYVRFDYDSDIYPSKIPVVTAWVKGKKTLDTRDSVTRWSPNVALMISDYLRLPVDDLTPGVGVDAANIDTTELNVSANSCDEFVTTTNLDDTIISADPDTEIITLVGLNSRLQYQTCDKVRLIGGSLPAGLAASTDYFVIVYQRKDTVRIKLASSLVNCLAGTAINITATGTGTIRKIAEPRYFGGGLLETTIDPKENIVDMSTAMAGSVTYISGTYKILAGFYRTPVFTFDEKHLLSHLTVRTKVSRKDRFNLIKGVYVAPINDGNPSDYPPVTNSNYVTADNDVTIPVNHDLPYTQRAHTAMRLAKIKLERHRQELFLEADFSIEAMQVQPGDTVNIDNIIMGWSGKPFEVINTEFDNTTDKGAPLFFVKLSLQETASTVYDWNNGEETVVDPAPNTNLPNPLEVDPPTSLTVVSIEIPTAEDDKTYKFQLSWTAPNDIFVTNGGHYEIQFKQTGEPTFNTSFDAKGSDTAIAVNQVRPGVNYDTRIRSVNTLGVKSQYNSLFGFNIDSPSGASIRLDFLTITGTITDFLDFGLITDAVDATNDYGTLT